MCSPNGVWSTVAQPQPFPRFPHTFSFTLASSESRREVKEAWLTRNIAAANCCSEGAWGVCRVINRNCEGRKEGEPAFWGSPFQFYPHGTILALFPSPKSWHFSLNTVTLPSFTFPSRSPFCHKPWLALHPSNQGLCFHCCWNYIIS